MSAAEDTPVTAGRAAPPPHGDGTPPTSGTPVGSSTDRYPPVLDVDGVEVRPHVGEPGPNLVWAFANAARSETAASAVAYFERRCADLEAQYVAVLAAKASELAKHPDDEAWARQVAAGCEQQFAAVNDAWARSMRDLDAGIAARHRRDCKELLVYAAAVATAAMAAVLAVEIARGLLTG